ncbi:MAG: hypothetical protein KY462_13515 [Actinobacteria bacterium]|nr:hypothetical protein [Actinomycetota bacterium]
MAETSATGPDAGPGGQARQPTEEEVAAYLAELRRTDVTSVVAQSFSVLASGAEVKLGRRDARLLIDAAAALADAVRSHADERLVTQMDQALTQLRTAQVDAEDELNKLRAEGKLPEEEAGDLPTGDRPAQGDAGGADDTQPTRPAGTSRLWVPGR